MSGKRKSDPVEDQIGAAKEVASNAMRNVYIGMAVTIVSTASGGIWAASELFSRFNALEENVDSALGSADVITERTNGLAERLKVMEQQLQDNDVGQLQGRLSELGTNLKTIMENQVQLLALKDKVADVEKLTSENSILVTTKVDSLGDTDKKLTKIQREIDDIWKAMDALSNPLK